MSFLYEYEWLLFLLSEALGWVIAVLFFIIRYRYKLERASRILLTLFVTLTLFQAALAGIDYYQSGTVSFFQVFIVMFILYAFTLGHADFVRLDLFIKQKFNPDMIVARDGLEEHLSARWKLVLVHSVAFIVAHSLWYVLSYGWEGFPNLAVYTFHEWIDRPHEGYFPSAGINSISYYWKLVYSFDLGFFAFACSLWVLRYFKRKRGSK